MAWFIKKMFIVLLTSLVNASDHQNFVSLSNQKSKIHCTLYNLHPNEYNQELHYYLFAVKLVRCAGSCNILSDLSEKVCVPNKTEGLSVHVFNMITGKNESKILAKHVSCKCHCKFDCRKCNSD